jgi:hypothetical protein
VSRGVLLRSTQPSEFRKNLFGRLLADVAGVEDDEVGVIDVSGLDKALAGQRVRHALGIVDIHLAAIRLDVQLARRRHEIETVGTWTMERKRPRTGAPRSNIA